MRDIKFRTWDKINKEMCMVGCLRWNAHHNLTVPHHVYDTIMQNTGLFDKNGVEIYEDDILKWSSRKIGKRSTFTNVLVSWDNIRGSWTINKESSFPLGIYSNIEIIGNVYQNPELLDK